MSVFFAGLWPIIWHLSFATLATAGLVAYALLTPVWFFPKTKVWALAGAAAVVIGTGCYLTGVSNESTRWQAKWDAAEKAAISRGDAARIGAGSADDRGVRDNQDTDIR